MENRKQLMSQIIGLDQEFQELYFKLHVIINRTENDLGTLLCYRKDVRKCVEIIQEIKELQRQQKLHHKIFEVLYSAKLKKDYLHTSIIFKNKQQGDFLQESIEAKKEENLSTIKELLGEPSSINKNPINLDSFIFNFRDSKETVEQLSIDDLLKLENQPETNWPQEIDKLEKRTRKLLEKKDEHH